MTAPHTYDGVFKTSDIRGVYPHELDERFAFHLGRALVRAGGARAVAVARDARSSSPALYAALLAGIRAEGGRPRPLGLSPTEVMYYAAGHDGVDLAVMITASHNPPEYNGFKVVRRGVEPVGTPELRRWVAAVEGGGEAPPDEPVPEPVDRIGDYIEAMIEWEGASVLAGRRIVVDAGNGAACALWPRAAARRGCEVVLINERPDGRFQGRGPDPYAPGALRGLVQTVRARGADLGLAFDGDADRVAVVSRDGTVLSGSDTLALIAQRILEAHPGGATVACNLVTSRRTLDYLAGLGWRRYLVPVGHGLIKPIMRSDPTLLFAGETSGHFYYRPFFCSDSAFLTSLIMIGIATKIPERLALLPSGWTAPEEEPRVRVGAREEALQRCRTAALDLIRREGIDRGDYELSCEVDRRIVTGRDLDMISACTGVRCDTGDGWFCLRPSGTEPIIRISGESRDAGLLSRWLSALEDAVG